MRRHFALMAVAVAALALALLPGASLAAAGALGGSWGTAQEVPGIAALDQGGSAGIRSVSCGAAGNCSAGGFYSDTSGHGQAFVANQANGTWGTAQQVPGLAALNTGGAAGIFTVSCGAAGNCSAGGFYQDSSGHGQAFVANETNGTWGAAQEVPGLAALNKGDALTYSVSCGSAGNCGATGTYTDTSGDQQVFVVNEINGTWGAAQEVPGIAALNQGGFASVLSVSCGAAGNCSAGGSYIDGFGHQQAFVVNETSGTWGKAEEVPGTAALNPRGSAIVAGVSCASAGDCGAGGFAGGHAFVANETNGTWHAAKQVPGIATLSHGHHAEIDSVSCASPGNCSAGGYFAYYLHGFARSQVFVATETNGTWGTAREVPGIATLNKGDALTYSVACGSAGNCSDVGYYSDAAGHLQAFVANQANGTWGAAQEIPGTAALNTGGVAVAWSVSCVSAGNCSAGGNYNVNSGHEQPFVVSETPHTSKP